MEKPFVDPLVLVGYLLAEFDGSERMIGETHRAMLLAVNRLPAGHQAREMVESLVSDLTVAAFAAENGDKIETFQSSLVARWEEVLRQIKRASLH